MRDEDNIRELAGLGPEYIGFIFYEKSKRFVGEEFNPSVTDKVPEYIKKVGVFVNEDPGYVETVAHKFKLDLVQLHGTESAGYCRELAGLGIKIIKAFSLNARADFSATEAYTESCEYFLFDTDTPLFGGSGEKFNWSVLKKYTGNKPFFLSGGIGPGDTAAILSLHHHALAVLDLNSRFEVYPGHKDINLLKPFFNQIRESK